MPPFHAASEFRRRESEIFRFFRDRHGVSEVVASLTMILIVSIAGTALYSYSMNTFGSSGSSLQLQTDSREEQARERFSIISIWWDTYNQLNLTVLNHGKIDLAIDAVYIDGTAVTAFVDGKGEMVTIGDIVCVKFTSPITILDGQTYEIIAVSERGSRDVVYWKA